MPFLRRFMYDLPFWRYKALMTLRTRLSDAFHHLVPNDNFDCQTPLKNAKFDLFGTDKCWLANFVVDTDGLILIVTVQ